MGIFSFYYKRHFKDDAELQAQLIKDGIIDKPKAVAKPIKKEKIKDDEKQEVIENG